MNNKSASCVKQWMKFCLSAVIGTCIFAAATVARADNSYFGHIEAPCNKLDNRAQCIADFEKLLLQLDQCMEVSPCDPGRKILETIFGATYHPELPDYVVYFDQSVEKGSFKKHRPVMMWNNENTPYLRGAQNIYVLVFSQHRICLGATVTTEFRNEPNPFAAVFSTLGATNAAPEQKQKPSESSEGRFNWFPLSGDPNPDASSTASSMWFALTRLRIDVNTANRITVRYVAPDDIPQEKLKDAAPNDPCRDQLGGSSNDSTATRRAEIQGSIEFHANKVGNAPDDVGKYSGEVKGNVVISETGSAKSPEAARKYSGDFVAANGFFSNSVPNFAAVSLALGVTANTKNTAIGSGGSDEAFNGYALVKFFIYRPRISVEPRNGSTTTSLGIVMGTNLADSPFDEMVIGVSVGHLLGNTGLVFGVNSIAGKKDTDSGRRDRPFIGVDYTF